MQGAGRREPTLDDIRKMSYEDELTYATYADVC
jgi:hypothetical protein